MFSFLKRDKPEVRPEPARRRVAGRGGQRMFMGAETDRLTGKQPSMPLVADDIIRRNQRVLVARSRYQAANNDYAKSFLRMARQNIVGPDGVMLQAQSQHADGSIDQMANDAIEVSWWEWGRRKNCDVTGQQSWRSIQNSCVMSAAKDGEFMVRLIFGRDGGPWGFSVQVLDPQRCPVDFDENDRRSGSFVRHGIEFNRYGRPLAYYFTTTNEAEADYHFGGRHFQRIPANEIVHGFLPEIVGQKRGLPWMATALWRLHQLGGFENSALVNARVSASKGGFFEWEEGYGPEPDEDDEIYMEAEPGTFQELPAGVRFKEWNPQYPSGEFAPFHKAMLRGMAAGLGVAYNNLASDLEGVNYSSIRQGTLDEREHWKDLQEWLIETLIEPVFEAWLPRALLDERITIKGTPLNPARLDKYRAVEWQARRWLWIDPRADIDAAVTGMNNLLLAPGQIIREQGRDPMTVWREIASDIDTMRALGIPDEFIKLAISPKMGNLNHASVSKTDDG